MSKKALTIWFDDKGNLLEQVGSWATNNQTWAATHKSELAEDFNDVMEYIRLVDYSRGSARVHLKSLNSGRVYSMFALDFHKIIIAKKFIDNRVSGTFHFSKKGSAQAINLIIEKTP